MKKEGERGEGGEEKMQEKKADRMRCVFERKTERTTEGVRASESE